MSEIQLLTTHSLMGQPLRFQEGRPPSPWIFCVAAAFGLIACEKGEG